MKRRLALTGVVAVLSFLGISKAEDLNVVVGANPLWTDTQISLTNGDVASITASGSWSWGENVEGQEVYVGPDGDPLSPSTDVFFSGALLAGLIAFVGSDPYQGHWGDGSFFPQTNGYWNIGSSGQFTSDKTGELWLGFNDDATSKQTGDNAGSVTAQISVIPEPSTITLALLGIGAVLGSMRLRGRSS